MLLDIGRGAHRRDQADVINVIFWPRQKLTTGTSVNFTWVQVLVRVAKNSRNLIAAFSPALARIDIKEVNVTLFGRVGK
jgi:hypothetical protein